LASITDVEEGNQKNPTAIKYRVESISVGDSLLANTEQTFQVIVTWDKSVDITSDHMEKEIKVTLNYEQKTGTPDVPTPSAQNATELITSKNTSGNSEGLFTDDYGNIRYRGSNSEVKNYVTFNGETWRIIGLFYGKIKLIRNNSVNNMKWNHEPSNNWSTSSTKDYLNGTYYNSLSSTAKNQIEPSTFYLGGTNTVQGVYSKDMYLKERGTAVYTGNPTTITQNIGLMYPSDYGYASRSSCDRDLSYYDFDPNCSTEGNWLFHEPEEWFQTPRSDTNSNVLSLAYDGYVVVETSTASLYQIRPVLFLKPSVQMTVGDGTSANPYIIS
ncbi:MAG: hypothetical protein KH135_06000, partial [Firmicutes bacterium]|nr:hypothetical protein [Bacillota bacterium]